MNLKTIDDGRVTVAADFLPLLQAEHLGSFDSIMTWEGGNLVRDFPGRRTVRLDLKQMDGSVQGVYLKRYEPNYLSPAGKLLRFLRWPGAEDEAAREWHAIEHVRSLGIQTPTQIALGQKRTGGIVQHSFLMTAEIRGSIEGHTFLEGLPPPEVRPFLAGVAELARRFHQAGLVHKDFYLGHVLVVPRDTEPPRLYLMNLQRVVRPGYARARWIAKDLGALAYSTLNAGASRTALLRGFLAYCNVARLGPAEKKLARKILRRVNRLRRRGPKHDGPFPPAPAPSTGI